MLLTFLLMGNLTADSALRAHRYERWAEERRIDLCAEEIIQCPDDKRAEQLANRLPFRKWPFPPDKGMLGPEIKHFGPAFKAGNPRSIGDSPYHYTGRTVFASRNDSDENLVFVRADKCIIEFINRASWFVAVRDEIVEQFRADVKDYPGEWYRSVVIVGDSTTVPRCDLSLIVCDGDLKMNYWTKTSAIVANGNIELCRDIYNCKVYAAGTIKAPPKGRVELSELHEKGKGMPVVFLDLERDLGLRVSDKLALEDDWGGLRKGDVITKVDGAAVDSVRSLRKHLRRGIVKWSAAVEARRGGEVVVRTVRLDVPPLPVVAPPTRAAKP